MGQKKLDFQFCWFLTLSSFSVLILFPAGKHVFLLFPILLFLLTQRVPGRTFLIKKQYLAICIPLLVAMWFVLLRIRISATLALGIPIECVNSVSGKVIYDSSFTQTNNHFMTISLSEVGTTYGQRISAKGLINVIGDEKAIITSGIKITLYGKFSNDYFKYSSLQILSRSHINDIREFIITELEKRMVGQNPTNASVLSTMLIMGRADDYFPAIKEKAKECGCSHVLALSGMHLNSLSLVFKPVKNKAVKYVLTVIASTLFVFVAGPRPSLVRAMLMLIFSFLPLTEKLVVSYIIQMAIFPFSMVNIGCIYSYLAIFAIAYITPLVKNTIPFSPLAASVAVLSVISPVVLFTEGCWYPWSIVVGPLAGLLITACMFVGFGLAICGPCKIITKLNNILFNLLNLLMEKFSNKASCGWKEYSVFLIVTLGLIIAPSIKKVLLKQRFKKLRKNLIMEL